MADSEVTREGDESLETRTRINGQSHRAKLDSVNPEDDENYFLFQDTDEHIQDDYFRGFTESPAVCEEPKEISHDTEDEYSAEVFKKTERKVEIEEPNSPLIDESLINNKKRATNKRKLTTISKKRYTFNPQQRQSNVKLEDLESNINNSIVLSSSQDSEDENDPPTGSHIEDSVPRSFSNQKNYPPIAIRKGCVPYADYLRSQITQFTKKTRVMARSSPKKVNKDKTPKSQADGSTKLKINRPRFANKAYFPKSGNTKKKDRRNTESSFEYLNYKSSARSTFYSHGRNSPCKSPFVASQLTISRKTKTRKEINKRVSNVLASISRNNNIGSSHKKNNKLKAGKPKKLKLCYDRKLNTFNDYTNARTIKRLSDHFNPQFNQIDRSRNDSARRIDSVNLSIENFTQLSLHKRTRA